MFFQCFVFMAVSAGTYLYPGNICSSRSVSCLKPSTISLNEGSCNQKQVTQYEITSFTVCPKHVLAVLFCCHSTESQLTPEFKPNPWRGLSLVIVFQPRQGNTFVLNKALLSVRLNTTGLCLW